MSQTIEDDPMLAAFVAIVQLADRMDVTYINKLPGGWEVQIGKWWFALNGHAEKVTCSHDVTVDPLCCYVEYNGWPAGLFNAFGGAIAYGEAANEQSFIEAVNAHHQS
jgi:hypothetical protein